jgi:hypothetical protein
MVTYILAKGNVEANLDSVDWLYAIIHVSYYPAQYGRVRATATCLHPEDEMSHSLCWVTYIITSLDPLLLLYAMQDIPTRITMQMLTMTNSFRRDGILTYPETTYGNRAMVLIFRRYKNGEIHHLRTSNSYESPDTPRSSVMQRHLCLMPNFHQAFQLTSPR